MISAFVLISAEPARIAGLGSELASVEGVVEAHSVAGSSVALVVKIWVKTHEDVATVVTEKISQLPGVTNTQTLISFRQYNDAEMAAMYDFVE